MPNTYLMEPIGLAEKLVARHPKIDHRCEKCGRKTIPKTTTRSRPYRSKIMGLPGAAIIGVTRHHCPTGKHGVAAVTFACMGQLLDAMALAVARKKGRLSAGELRYLTKWVRGEVQSKKNLAWRQVVR